MKVSKLIVALFFYYSALQIAFSQENSRTTLNPEKKSFSFGIVADIQYADADKKGDRDYRNSLSKLEIGVNEFNSHNLSFVVNLGDMIDHDYISFDKPLAILKNLKAPLHNVIGNHDFEVRINLKARCGNG